MKAIHVSQLRTGSFNLTSLVEETVEMPEDRVSRTHADLAELVGDLEGIREGLLFKRERLDMRLRVVEEGLKLERIDELGREIARMALEPLGTSKEVLERNRKINHLKRMEKAVKYLMEVERGNLKVLDSLISSDDEEDWKFLCFLLCSISRVVENGEEIRKYNKLVEDKMLCVFEEGSRQNNRVMMRAAYNSFREMGKESSLVHSYIYSLDLFKEPAKMEHKEEEVFDLDFHTEEHSAFIGLVGRVRDTYDSSFRDLGDVFCNTKDVYKIIHRKVYEDVLSTALGSYLKGMSPCMFLLSLESCHRNLQVLGSFIETIDADFDGAHATEDLVSQYVRAAVDKEKVLFEEIYDILVLRVQKQTRYVILGEEAGSSADSVFVYKQLLDAMSFGVERSRRLYDEAACEELTEFFCHKLCGFVNVVYGSTQDKLEVARTLKFVYLVTRRYFGDEFQRLRAFGDRVERKLQEALEDEIETCSMRIGVRIKQEGFTDREGHAKVLEVVGYEVDKASEMSVKGRNLRVLVGRILHFLYSALYNRILQIVFDEQQATNMAEYVDKVLEFAKEVGSVEAVQRFTHLRSMAMVISVSEQDFDSFYSTLVGKVSDDEISRVLRCRRDRERIERRMAMLGR